MTRHGCSSSVCSPYRFTIPCRFRTGDADIEDLDMDNIVTYVRPKSKMSAKWSEVPKDIKDTFERLGIPQAEQKSTGRRGRPV